MSNRTPSSDFLSNPRPPRRRWMGAMLLLILASFAALEWDLSAILEATERSRALSRLREFFLAFSSPELSGNYLAQALRLAGVTASIALCGSFLGVTLGYVLALGASRTVMLGVDPPQSLRQARRRGWISCGLHGLRLGVIEGVRLFLDVLRGVPDFAWAILILTLPGPGPVTGMLALGVNMAGILGKVFSELWDGVEPRRYESVRAVGAGRLATFWYGVQPLTSRAMLSYALMRSECAMRSATVVGAVGGGGLGLAMYDEFTFGHYGKFVTLLIFTLALTASADLLANFIRYQLREDPNNPLSRTKLTLNRVLGRRIITIATVLGTLVGAIYYLREGFSRAGRELQRIEWGFIQREFGRFLSPDLRIELVVDVVASCRIPLALAFLSTLFGLVMASGVAYTSSVAFHTHSHRFSGESRSAWRRFLSGALVVSSRTLALISRAIPEVVWVWVFAAFFRIGTIPGLLALGLHSAGVLGRVFTESVDNISYSRFERVHRGSRFVTFAYGAVPWVRADWMTYTFFQFESNVRMGVVLGILGIGGLGDGFHSAFSMRWALEEAATFLLAMILLTTVIDRLSRALKVSRVTLSAVS